MEYGLIGEKLGHSFSKEIHGMIKNYNYELTEISPDNLKGFLEKRAFKAINVTIPYKQQVIPFLDEISEEADTIGAVNCIVNDGGRLIGSNTDFYGLKSLIKHLNIDLKNKKVLILGTGGTSDTAYAVCTNLGAAKILKVSRRVAQDVVTYMQAMNEHRDAQIIINTTPCGMYPDNFSEPIDMDAFNCLEGVVDVIYNPLRTKLISDALARGIRAEGGLYMLVSQAVRASELFTGEIYSESISEDIYKRLYGEKNNIVLIGMPSSGKTTIGKIIAENTGRKLIDTDEMISQKECMSISEIFERYGEQYFRNSEAESVKEASKNLNCIISTGGGAVLRKENIEALKMNGIIFFLDRDVELLTPTEDRPTALDRQAIVKRYEERYDIYTKAADYVIKNNNTAEDAVVQIMEALR